MKEVNCRWSERLTKYCR